MNAPENVDQQAGGLYEKFIVTRTDEADKPGGKHHGDEYFVLNLSTDKHALPAIAAYARSCEEEFPLLARDLTDKLKGLCAPDESAFVTVPQITLPNGTVVPSFRVGKYHCSRSLGGLATVDPDNAPWNNINYHEARQACIDAGFSLITELQYLAIAFDICNQDENWSGGKVGAGEIFKGLHLGNESSPQPGGIVASTDPMERRWHVLSNGERVYDFSGNIYSWIFDDVQGDEKGVVAKKFKKDSPTVTTAPYPSREKGMGDTSVGGGDWAGCALVRGGCWGSVGDAGVFRVVGGWPDGSLSGVGFRCTKSL